MRYFNIIVLISSTCVYMQRKPSQNLCRCYFIWEATAVAVQIIVTHILLSARLFAMYNRSPKVLLLLVGLIVGEWLILTLAAFVPDRIMTNEPRPGVFICSVSEPPKMHWAVYSYATMILVEGVFLVMALWKAWLHRQSTGGSILMHQLTKGSVFYFFMIFWVYIVNLVIWINDNPIITEIGTSFSFVLPCILATRLMIHTRSTHYRAIPHSAIDTEYIDTYYLSAIRFGHTVAVDPGESPKVASESMLVVRLTSESVSLTCH